MQLVYLSISVSSSRSSRPGNPSKRYACVAPQNPAEGLSASKRASHRQYIYFPRHKDGIKTSLEHLHRFFPSSVDAISCVIAASSSALTMNCSPFRLRYRRPRTLSLGPGKLASKSALEEMFSDGKVGTHDLTLSGEKGGQGPIPMACILPCSF